MVAGYPDSLNSRVSHDPSLLLNSLEDINYVQDLYQIPKALMHNGLEERNIVMLKNQH
jgi:hypothetical protein